MSCKGYIIKNFNEQYKNNDYIKGNRQIINGINKI